MCGISTIISKDKKELKHIFQMNEVVKHRGPDGSDIKMFDNVALAHRRLSIIDLSDKGSQPMSFKNRYWIVYNGEIYNYKELKQELVEEGGYTFVSNTDTEVILAAYEYYDIPDFLNHLNGMFAFVIYDSELRSIFVARDRFGVKPLYYWQSRTGLLAFASEIKQFTELPEWEPIVNVKRAADFLLCGIVDHTDSTLFQNVYQIRGGEYGWIADVSSDVDLKIERWFDLKYKKCKTTYQSATSEVKNLLTDSVKIRLRSDVSVGSCLSGGIDSSSIVGLIHSLKENEEQKTISAYSNDASIDESKFVKIVLDSYPDIHAASTYPDVNVLFDELEKTIWHLDGPFPTTSMLAQREVFKKAKQEGLTVMLDGQGADELLAGYLYYFGIVFKNLFKQHKFLMLINEIRLASKIPGFSIIGMAKYYVPNKWKSQNKVFKDCIQHVCPDNTKTNIRTFSHYQITQSSLPALLHWEDRNSMAFGIEARTPFLDYRLVEYTYNLPGQWKISKGCTKRILRDAMSGIIPDTIRKRKDKKGFVTEEEKWFYENNILFENTFAEALLYTNEFVNTEEAMQLFKKMKLKKIKYNSIIWRIITFGIWMKVFDVKIPDKTIFI